MIMVPGSTDSSHLGLSSSLQMRKPGWPALDPGVLALPAYLQFFLAEIQLA